MTRLLVALFAAVTLCAWAQPPSIEEESPEFKDYKLKKDKKEWVDKAKDENGVEHSLGLIPPRVKFNPSHRQQVQVGAYPATFDLRTLNMVTAVRNQGACGSCWSFGDVASLESALLMQNVGTFDLSEDNIKDQQGASCCLGGNWQYTGCFLQNLRGPALESQVPYDPYNCNYVAYPPAVPFREIVLLPARTVPLDNDAIKNAVMTEGAVTIYYYESSTYYNSANYAYYYGISYANHAVAVVGWDDNFPKTNFRAEHQPAGDGAFLIRNSWGATSRMNGYFWMSYYELFGTAHVLRLGDDFGARHAYGYAPYGVYSKTGWNDNSDAVWQGMIFTADATENLVGFGMFTTGPSSDYSLYVYRNPPANSPVPTTAPIYTQSGTIAESGLFTLPFNSAIPVTQGDRLSFVIKVHTPGLRYNACMGLDARSPVTTGLTFIGPGGIATPASVSWWDVATLYTTSDGGKAALNLTVYGDNAEAKPRPTATPTITPTPSPTASPAPTFTPYPSPTPWPSPTLTPVPSPTATPGPTPTWRRVVIEGNFTITEQ